MKIPNKILNYIYLSRLDKPTGIYLLYFPCLFGSALAFKTMEEFLYYSVLYLIGSVLMRAAGCIINDMTDKDLDRYVERTKTRPLASGAISIREAIIFLFSLLATSLLILIQLNILAIIISLSSVVLIIIYPFMKRFTYWPQAFLGITFNIGVLISYANITNNVSPQAIILYLGCICWTLGYDTIYAFMDTEDDLKIGIKSSAIAIKAMNYKLILLQFYSIFIVCVIMSISYAKILSEASLGIVFIASFILIWQVFSLDIKNPQNCLKRFMSNRYVGGIITLALFISRLEYLKLI
jgi:4-hydroxybenzoate polyprenyltransferase